MREDLEEILDIIDIESWMDRQGVQYRRTRGKKGVQLNVKECPVCGNANWKVYINAETGLGNCFHGDCETKFNKWKFIRSEMGGLFTQDVIEHCKQVAKEQGWRPPKVESVPVNMKTELKLPDSYPIPINGKNLKYLDNRNISIEIAQYFKLRFSMSGVFEYYVDSKRLVQSYEKRIIIPVFDLDGNLVSFQGRDITGTAEKKYLFPPGFASTGSIIYNGHNALGAEHIVLGEGVFDVMATKIALDGQMDLREVEACGTFGKHLSSGDENSQVAKLMQMKDKGLKIITFMWDSEERAIEDAIEAALGLNRLGFSTRIALLPKDRDPNEVPASVVRSAFWKAETVNQSVAARIRLAKRAA